MRSGVSHVTHYVDSPNVSYFHHFIQIVVSENLTCTNAHTQSTEVAFGERYFLWKAWGPEFSSWNPHSIMKELIPEGWPLTTICMWGMHAPNHFVNKMKYKKQNKWMYSHICMSAMHAHLYLCICIHIYCLYVILCTASDLDLTGVVREWREDKHTDTCTQKTWN